MTYQAFAKHTIQITLILIIVLFAWVFYHQAMSTMSMGAMPDHQSSPLTLSCVTFCFIVTKVEMDQLIQSIYYSFVDIASAYAMLFALTVLAYLGLYYLRYHQSVINLRLQRLTAYYHQQRWKFKLFSLWSSLYQQGIIAPQVYS